MPEATTFVNLTPHDVSIIVEGKVVLQLPCSGREARVGMHCEQVGDLNGIPLFRQSFDKDITGLPEPKVGTAYIVSTLVAQAAKDRRDLYVPAGLVREGGVRNGTILGATGLQQFWE